METIFLLLVSLISLTGFMYFSYLIGGILKTSHIMGIGLGFWTFLVSILVASVCSAFWILLDSMYDDKQAEPLLPRPSNNEDERQIRVAKYNQVYGEITRYRDLAWKIGLLAWAAYYGLNWVSTQQVTLFWKLPPDIFFLSIPLAALCATVFLIYCEHTANRNRRIRREIEEVLILDKEWRFKIEREDPFHPSLWVSVGIFLLFIWTPVLIMLLFRNK